MPKVKTNSSAKKRFKVTGTGEITFQKAFKRHILTKKSTKRKRSLRKKGVVSDANRPFCNTFIAYEINVPDPYLRNNKIKNQSRLLSGLHSKNIKYATFSKCSSIKGTKKKNS